jgi:nicotinamide-nucleotide adenylyltransferase
VEFALRALYVGRFQPFHLGHLEAIKYMLNEISELVIVIGSAQYSHTREDPFTAGERVTMIRLALNEVGKNPSRYYIIPVPDLNIHDIWVSHVLSYTPKFEKVYTNEPLTSRLFLEDGRFQVKSIPLKNRQFYSATEIRERILKKEDWEELVPRSVTRFIKEIRGEERLQDLIKTDSFT